MTTTIAVADLADRHATLCGLVAAALPLAANLMVDLEHVPFVQPAEAARLQTLFEALNDFQASRLTGLSSPALNAPARAGRAKVLALAHLARWLPATYDRIASEGEDWHLEAERLRRTHADTGDKTDEAEADAEADPTDAHQSVGAYQPLSPTPLRSRPRSRLTDD